MAVRIRERRRNAAGRTIKVQRKAILFSGVVLFGDSAGLMPTTCLKAITVKINSFQAGVSKLLLIELRSAGAATAGAATGTRTLAGTGYGPGDAAHTGGECGKGGHLRPGGLMAPGTISDLSGLT
jgi:hypothetical protein